MRIVHDHLYNLSYKEVVFPTFQVRLSHGYLKNNNFQNIPFLPLYERINLFFFDFMPMDRNSIMLLSWEIALSKGSWIFFII